MFLSLSSRISPSPSHLFRLTTLRSFPTSLSSLPSPPPSPSFFLRMSSSSFPSSSSPLPSLRLPRKEDRPHEVFYLKNGLQVVIVSDKEADSAAAAMDVRVGHLSDPWDIPGMAHFLEHMLFLGIAKYPDENSYSSFLQTHGGRSNAYTATENTNYYFDVVHGHLEEALDRFSQFFVAPLFTESATDRERNAIESEHSKNLQTDSRRIHYLFKSLINPSHPYSKFGTGNLLTLKDIPEQSSIDVRERLKSFYHDNYSASIMKLAVVGRDSLPTLREWVETKFSDIPTTGISPPYPPWGKGKKGEEGRGGEEEAPEAFPSGTVGKLYKVVPVRDLRQLRILFPTPPLRELYKKKPSRYITHLLGHEGKGSILSALKKKGLATSLSAGLSKSLPDFSVFSVQMTLTEKGREEWKEVVGLVFEYLREMKKEGVKEWVWEEMKDVEGVQFEEKEKAEGKKYVGRLCENMQVYDVEDIVSGGWMLSGTEFDQELISDFLDHLTVDNMFAFLISQKFGDVADQEEKWFKTRYTSEEFSPETLEAWKSTNYSNDSLHEPSPNIYIPRSLAVKPLPSSSLEQQERRDPEVVYESDIIRGYHKQDDHFNLPKMNCFVHFYSPVASGSTWGLDGSNLFAKLCDDELNEELYDADLCGLSFHLSGNYYTGIDLKLSGFDEKMPLMAHKIVETMLNFRPSQDRFDDLKEKYLRDMKNVRDQQPWEIAAYEGQSVFNHVYWTVDERIESIKKLTLDDMFIIQKRLFSEVKIDSLMHGNITPSEAVEFVKQIESCFKSSTPLPLSQKPERRVIKLPNNEVTVIQKLCPNPENINSCAMFFLQIGEETLEMNAVSDLFERVLREPAFDTLRTKEQLGYIVFASCREYQLTRAMRITVQSSVADPLFLEQRIENFLKGFESILQEMSEETFAENVESLVTLKLKKDHRLSQESYRAWQKIYYNLKGYDHREREAEAVKKLTKQDLIDFYNTYIAKNAPKRKKLIIQIFGNKHPLEEAGKIGPGELGEDLLADEVRNTIDNASEWKRKQPLYPTTPY